MKTTVSSLIAVFTLILLTSSASAENQQLEGTLETLQGVSETVDRYVATVDSLISWAQSVKLLEAAGDALDALTTAENEFGKDSKQARAAQVAFDQAWAAYKATENPKAEEK